MKRMDGREMGRAKVIGIVDSLAIRKGCTEPERI